MHMQRLYLFKFRFVAFNSWGALERCDLRFHDFRPRQRATNVFVQRTLVYFRHTLIYLSEKKEIMSFLILCEQFCVVSDAISHN